MSDPTRIDTGIKAVKSVQRVPCGIVISYDPNSGAVNINVSGFASPVEEIGAFEYAKQMRMALFVKMADPQQKDIVVAPAGAVPPFKQ